MLLMMAMVSWPVGFPSSTVRVVRLTTSCRLCMARVLGLLFHTLILLLLIVLLRLHILTVHLNLLSVSMHLNLISVSILSHYSGWLVLIYNFLQTDCMIVICLPDGLYSLTLFTITATPFTPAYGATVDRWRRSQLNIQFWKT